MKCSLIVSMLVLTASAYRCKFDRIKDLHPQLCSDSGKVGDQTENDNCSNKHTNSCYKVHHNTPGDPLCKLVVTQGGGCDSTDFVYAEIPCIPGQTWYEPRDHSYIVRCT
jgi:hypothetical protein